MWSPLFLQLLYTFFDCYPFLTWYLKSPKTKTLKGNLTQRIYHNFDFNLVYITLKLRCGDKNCLWKISQHLFKLNWVVNLCYLMHKWIPPYFFPGSQGIDSRVCTSFSLFKRISAKSTMLFCPNTRDIRFSNIQQTTNSLIARALSRSLNVLVITRC